MNGNKKNESGFSGVELILIIVVVAILAVVSYMVYKNYNKTTTTSTNLAPATSVNSNAGWKTYYFKVGKFSLRYPSNWTLGSTNTSLDVGEIEAADITGPNNFDLSYSLDKVDPTNTKAAAQQDAAEIGNPNPDVADAYTVISSFTPVNYPMKLYVVYNSYNHGDPGGPLNYVELSAYSSYQSQPLGIPAYYPMKNNSNYIAGWSGGYALPSGGPLGMPTAEFLAKPEVKTAVQILESISYKEN